MFKGLIKLLGGILGEAVLDEFEDRVESTLDQAKVSIERIAENVVRKVLAASLLVIGLILGLVGLGIFLSRRVAALSDGIGFVVVGLVIVILALVAKNGGRARE